MQNTEKFGLLFEGKAPVMNAIYFMVTYVSVSCLEESHQFLHSFSLKIIRATPGWDTCKFYSNKITWKLLSTKWLLLF